VIGPRLTPVLWLLLPQVRVSSAAHFNPDPAIFVRAHVCHQRHMFVHFGDKHSVALTNKCSSLSSFFPNLNVQGEMPSASASSPPCSIDVVARQQLQFHVISRVSSNINRAIQIIYDDITALLQLHPPILPRPQTKIARTN
jgi:hypothetical protein